MLQSNIARYGERVQAEWQDGAEIDVQHEMMRVTLGIVGKTLFNAEVLDEANELGPALDAANEYIGTELDRMIHWPLWWPLPRIRKARRAIGRLDATIYRLIHERRRTNEDASDILSMLLAAQHDDARGGLTDKQVRDEALTMFAAGYETTGTALTWAHYLLAQHPAIYARLREEADSMLMGRPASLDDLPRLPFALQVLKEAMRLYPPAYGVGRRPLRDIEICGYLIPKGLNTFLSFHTMHRRPDLYPDPERFDPNRFAPENEKKIPKHAYVPFATGPRVCIGNHFAMMEGQMLLATLAQRTELELVPRQIRYQSLITLRAQGGIRMKIKRRDVSRVAA